jgi:general secretion pathway protein C
VASNGPATRGDLSRLFGVDAPAPVAVADAEPGPDSRFQLVGVLAALGSSAAREGVALIAVDGKPAKAYRVGAVVDGQTILKSVAARGAALGPRDGDPQVNLTLSALPSAATGSLPGLGGQIAAPATAPAPAAATAAPPVNSLEAARQKFQRAVQPNLLPQQPLQPGRTNDSPQMGPQPQGLQNQQAPAGANRRVLPPPVPQGLPAMQMPPVKAPLYSDSLPKG